MQNAHSKWILHEAVRTLSNLFLFSIKAHLYAEHNVFFLSILTENNSGEENAPGTLSTGRSTLAGLSDRINGL